MSWVDTLITVSSVLEPYGSPTDFSQSQKMLFNIRGVLIIFRASLAETYINSYSNGKVVSSGIRTAGFFYCYSSYRSPGQ